ncbi:MAG: peptidoglycan-binding protein [Oscillospiraceae bacterium]|nr:peptidoglycan-binding protein [Oscillospiraceae bacterium]
MTENAKRIWQILRSAGMTEAGAAAMLGNMQAESALRANNAQDGMTRLSDANYTAAADRGEIDFAGDSVGYGLCQWTYPTRKAQLLRFARAAGKTVGDLAMQVDFCIKELREDYPGLWSYLCRTEDLESAAGRICREFERPAVDNSAERASYAEKWYEELCHCEASAHTGCGNPSSSDFWPPRTIALGMSGPDVLLWQALMGCRGYACPTSGSFDKPTEAVTREYQQAAGLVADGIPGPKTWRKGLSA